MQARPPQRGCPAGGPGGSLRSQLNHFIDGRGAKALTRIAILFGTTRGADIHVQHVQVRRLVFIVRDRGMIYISHFIESELAVEAKSLVTLRRIVSVITVTREFLHSLVTWLLMISIENSP